MTSNFLHTSALPPASALKYSSPQYPGLPFWALASAAAASSLS